MSLPPSGKNRRRLLRTLSVLAGLALLVLALAGAAWIWHQPLLDHWLRPQLERVLGKRLGATVSLERLVLDPGRLRLERLVLDQPGSYHLVVPAVSIDWSLAQLGRRHLDGIQVSAPELTLDRTSSDPHLPPGVVIPGELPLILDRFVLLDGWIDLRLPDQTIRISGLHLEFLANALPNLILALRLGDRSQVALTASGHGTWDEEPVLTLTSLQIDERQLLATPLTLGLPIGRPTVGGEVVFGRVDRALVERLLATIDRPELLPPGLDFELQDLRLGLELAATETRLRLMATAVRLERNGLLLPLTSLKLTVTGHDQGWQGEGEFLLAEVHPGNFRFRTETDGVTGEGQGVLAEVRSLPPLLRIGAAWPLTGGVEWSAQFSWHRDRLTLAGQFRGRRGFLKAGDLLSLAALQGTLELSGPPDRLRVLAGISLEGRRLLTLKGSSDNLAWTLRPTALATLAGLLQPQAWPTWLMRSGSLAGAGTLAPSNPGWRSRFKLTGDNWRVLDVAVADPTVSGVLMLRQGRVEVGELSLTTTGLTGHGVTASRLTLRGQASWNGGEIEAKLVEARTAGIEYLAADGLTGLGGGEVALHGALTWDPGQQTGRVDLEGTLRAGEVLVGSFYGDLAGLAAGWTLAASGSLAQRSLLTERLTLNLPGVGTLEGTGEIAADSIFAQGKLNLPDLATAYGTHLKPLLAPVYPQLGELRLAGGLALEFSGSRNPSGLRLEGTLVPAAVDIENPAANLSLQGLAGEVPFALGPPAQTSSRGEREGHLAFTRLQVGPMTGGPARLALTTGPNRLSFRDPWRFSLAAGEITIGGLHFGREPEGLLTGGSIRLGGVDLEQLTRELGLTPMAGRIDADLGEFQYLAGLLQSEGEARIDAFGGSIRVRNLVARDVFSSYRSFAGDIDLTGLDLYQMTQTFAFGEMNGIIDGYIHDLRLFGAVPTAFAAEVQSRTKGKRNISVKALGNLTVISQGSLSAALSRGLYRFIDFYRYHRIGIRCTLKNDVFVLRGTAREDSDRYLVAGSLLPPRIDIIAPETTISFKQMLQRLQRIDRSGH
jgi:hypothetical protein